MENQDRLYIDRVNLGREDWVSVGFGYNDRLGRHIGIKTQICKWTYRLLTTEEGRARHYYGVTLEEANAKIERGEYWTVTSQTTRDGKDKQASHESKWFPTREAALDHAAKHVEAARKRAASPVARTKA